MKHFSINKFNKFYIYGILLWVIPTFMGFLLVINSIDFEEPLQPKNEQIFTQPIIDATFTEKSIEIKKKPKQKKIKQDSVRITQIKDEFKRDSLNTK